MNQTPSCLPKIRHRHHHLEYKSEINVPKRASSWEVRATLPLQFFWVVRILEGFVERVTLELHPKIWSREEMEQKSIHSLLAQWHKQSLGG